MSVCTCTVSGQWPLSVYEVLFAWLYGLALTWHSAPAHTTCRIDLLRDHEQAPTVSSPLRNTPIPAHLTRTVLRCAKWVRGDLRISAVPKSEEPTTEKARFCLVVDTCCAGKGAIGTLCSLERRVRSPWTLEIVQQRYPKIRLIEAMQGLPS